MGFSGHRKKRVGGAGKIPKFLRGKAPGPGRTPAGEKIVGRRRGRLSGRPASRVEEDSMTPMLRMLPVALACMCAAAPARAHHSFAVEYDKAKPVEGTGVLSKVDWTNPHMRIYVDCTDDKGVVTTWNLELGSPNSVLRRGWKPSDLRPGQKVSFKGYGGRKVLTRAAADVLTLADGRSFTGASGAPDANADQYGVGAGVPIP